MGEVYRARDTHLRREVAIKVLPAEVASSPERLALRRILNIRLFFPSCHVRRAPRYSPLRMINLSLPFQPV